MSRTIEDIKREIVFGKTDVDTMAKVNDIFGPTDQISDGFHTFDSLYHQRAILFAALVNTFPDRAWKTHYHEDGEPCFGGGWFLVTIETPKGAYGYRYKDEYWDKFKCKEIPKAKHWDGYTEEDVDRLLSLGRPTTLNIENIIGASTKLRDLMR